MELIPLTQGKFAQVDDEDFKELSKYKWYARKSRNTYYAERNMNINGKWKTIRMHRVILSTNPDLQIDHIDENGLNNRRSNLRIATHQENLRNQNNAHRNNKLGIRGVCRNHKKFCAHIQVNGRKIYLGRFFCLEKAMRARREAELKYFDEFASKDQFSEREKHVAFNNN